MLLRPVLNNRRQLRKRMLKGGIIAFSGRHATLACVVRDISDTGARLQVTQANGVPDTFELIIELDGFEAPVEVVWRTVTEIGVRFLSQPSKVAPKRAQSVDVTVPASSRTKPTLRRAEVMRVPAASCQAVTTGAASPASPSVTPAAQKPARPARSIPIVIADDDHDDRMMFEDAFRESDFQHPFTFVENGEELLKYLHGSAPYQDRELPGMILLDLNMPRMDGRTALMHIKSDAKLRCIPVIILTTSNADDDIQRTYDLGVSAFIAKPSSFEGLKEMVEALNNYWLRFVSLPVRAATSP